MDDETSVITFNKWVLVITALLNDEGQYPSKIAKEVDVTFSHTVKVLNELKSRKLVEKTRSGRTCIYKLTLRGLAIAQRLSEVKDFLQEA